MEKLIASSVNNLMLSHEEIKEMRDFYLGLIDCDNPNTIFETLQEMLLKQLKINKIEKQITLFLNNQFISVSLPIALGRMNDNKVIYGNSQDLECSRINTILLGCENKIYIIDFWSLTGTYVLCDGISKFSTPNFRKSIICDINETLKIKIGETNIICNPPECIICKSYIREIKFLCGHFVSCKECSMKINSCPICREPKRIDFDFDNCYFKTFQK
jgi:hypothetical protein